MKKTQVVMLLVVVAMFAMTASAQYAVVLQEDWNGMLGVDNNLGAFDTDDNEGSFSWPTRQHEWEAYAVGPTAEYGHVARTGGDGYAMMLDFNGETGAGVDYGIRGGLGYTKKGAAATVPDVSSTGEAAIAANGQYTTDVYFYWPTATYGNYGNSYLCNGGGYMFGGWGSINLDLTFQGHADVLPSAGDPFVPNPDEQSCGVGAWFGLLNSSPVYDAWEEGRCGCPEAPASDGDLIRMRVFTHGGYDGWTGTSCDPVYVDAFVPCAEWLHLVVDHNLNGSGANGEGVADYYIYAQDGTLLHSGTLDLVDGSVPKAIGPLGVSPGEDPYMHGPVFYDDYQMLTTVAGDTDIDGDVDAADYGAWQSGFGELTDGKWRIGDFDGDGDVDAADYGTWQANFGTTPPSGAVPEPITLTLLGLGGLALLKRRRQ